MAMMDWKLVRQKRTKVCFVQKQRGCVKMLAQLFFMRKAQTFPSPGFVIT